MKQQKLKIVAWVSTPVRVPLILHQGKQPPLVPSPSLVKPVSKELKGCYAQDSLVRSYLLSQEEQFLKEYEAITTWGSVFSKPTLKSSHIH